MADSTHGGGWQVPPPLLNFNPLQLHSWLTLLVLGPIFVDGCIRRSLFQPQSTTSTTTSSRPLSTPSMEETTATTLTPTHKQACSIEEVQSTNCLHGGTCYVVVLNTNRQSFCHCTEDWTGTRCEQFYIDPAILASLEQNMRTANIAAGVSVCILVLFVLLLASYVYLRKKHRTRRSRSAPDEPGVTTSLEPNGRASDGRETQIITIDSQNNSTLETTEPPPPPKFPPVDDASNLKLAPLAVMETDGPPLSCLGVKSTL